MFRRILVPVDLTEKSRRAVDVAFDLAAQSMADVTLLHVIETIDHIPFEEMKDWYARLDRSARIGLSALSERFENEGLNVATVVNYGHRTQGIVDLAVANEMDLIVLASHRIDPDRTGYDWSTISYGVAILAPCPVLLIK
jgi:nucleotide-binding universal stress UspA family protein